MKSIITNPEREPQITQMNKGGMEKGKDRVMRVPTAILAIPVQMKDRKNQCKALQKAQWRAHLGRMSIQQEGK